MGQYCCKQPRRQSCSKPSTESRNCLPPLEYFRDNPAHNRKNMSDTNEMPTALVSRKYSSGRYGDWDRHTLPSIPLNYSSDRDGKSSEFDSGLPEIAKSIEKSSGSPETASFQDAVGSQSFQHSEEQLCYETFGKGLLVVILKTDGRDGFEADRSAAVNFFENTLGFDVKVYNHMEPLLVFLDSVKSIIRCNSSKYYCLFFLISCHGNKDGMTIGDCTMKMKKVEEMFNNMNLRELSGCPKIFIANFCRGDATEELVEKATALLHSTASTGDSDIMTVYATTKGKTAYMNADGSVLPKAFIETLNRLWQTSHLADMVIHVQRKVMEWTGQYKEKQTVEVRSTLSKFLYLKSAVLKSK